jgi:predicted secreted protein
MDMRISFISTSMIGFECIWTSIFMALQIGMRTYLGSFSGVTDVGVNSG